MKIETRKTIWYSAFGLIMIAILAVIIFVPGAVEEGDRKTVASWGEDPVEEVTTPQVIESVTMEVRYEPAYFDGDSEASYWFVLAKERNKGVYWNDYQKHPASYFMPSECFRQLKGKTDKDFFLLDFIQISEGTYEDAMNNNLD